MNPAPQPWSEAEDSLLRKLWGAGIEADDIGLRMQRSKRSVLGRRRRLGLPGRRVITKRITPRHEPEVQKVLEQAKPIRLAPPLYVPPQTFPSPKCTWIFGEPKEHQYCDLPSQRGKSWCPYHCTKVFNVPR